MERENSDSDLIVMIRNLVNVICVDLFKASLLIGWKLARDIATKANDRQF